MASEALGVVHRMQRLSHAPGDDCAHLFNITSRDNSTPWPGLQVYNIREDPSDDLTINLPSGLTLQYDQSR